MRRWYREALKMPHPSDDEIAQWEDGIVYGTTSDGTNVYFNVHTRTWRKVRQLRPNYEPWFEDTPAG